MKKRMITAITAITLAGALLACTKSVQADASLSYALADNKDITIDDAGTYRITGSAQNSTIYVDADSSDKVTIILASASVTNEDEPCIYVKNAGEVTVSTERATVNSLTVSGSIKESDDDKANAVIYSKDDVVLAGEGELVIDSANNAVRTSDDIRVEGGTITIQNCYDGLHAEDGDDDTKGNIVITGGTLYINATDDAIHATRSIMVEDGTLKLSGGECLESTVITVNGGDIDISATDDGINAAAKSSDTTPVYEQNGGSVTIKMAAGDTDGVDSNGNIYINGGTIDITGQSAFDYDGVAEHNGGQITVNGKATETIDNQFMGGAPGQFEEGERPEGLEPPAEGEPGEFANGERPEGFKRGKGPRMTENEK